MHYSSGLKPMKQRPNLEIFPELGLELSRLKAIPTRARLGARAQFCEVAMLSTLRQAAFFVALGWHQVNFAGETRLLISGTMENSCCKLGICCESDVSLEEDGHQG
eukprot:s1618_g4.t1